MKEWLSAQELTDLKLNSLPKSKSNVISRAKKECWANRKKVGRGGGLEYAFDGLPKDVQAEIKALQVKATMAVVAKPKHEVAVIDEVESRDISQATHAERDSADCKHLMGLLVIQYSHELGTIGKAKAYVSELSRNGALPVIDGVDYNEICQKAKSKLGKSVGVGERILAKWVGNAKKAKDGEHVLKLFLPKRQGQPVKLAEDITWLPYFLMVFCTPNGKSVAESYKDFSVAYGAEFGSDNVPHIDAVYRALKKLPAWVREHRRLTGSKMRALRAFVRRDWNADWMKANDIWVIDGHSLKCKVQHPVHGRPFTPELTIVMDTVTRYIVGWSISFSESMLAVSDAVRFAIRHNGKPVSIYTDNGAGEKNHAFDHEVTGMYARLGITHMTGIPGNPQGRGIIERQMKEVPKRVAQSFPTYYGDGADPETVRKVLYAVDSRAKALEKNKSEAEMTDLQRKAKDLLPTWDMLIAEVEARVHDYNHNRVHRVIGKTPAQKRVEMVGQLSGEELVYLSDAELKDMFRPSFKRAVARGEVRFMNKLYFHKDLEVLDGKDVMVCVDIHDPKSVIVRDLDGRWLCEAVLKGNQCDAYPRSFIEDAREKSRKAMAKLKLDQLAVINHEQRQVIEHEKSVVIHELIGDSYQTKQVTINKPKEIVFFECDKAVNE